MLVLSHVGWIQAEQNVYPFSTIARSSIVSLSDEYELSVSLLVSSATSVWQRESSEIELLIGSGDSNSVTQLQSFVAAHSSSSSSSTTQCRMPDEQRRVTLDVVARHDGEVNGVFADAGKDSAQRFKVAAGISATSSSSAKFTTCLASLCFADFLRFPLSKAEPTRDISEGFAQFLSMFMRLCVEQDASSSHVIGRVACGRADISSSKSFCTELPLVKDHSMVAWQA